MVVAAELVAADSSVTCSSAGELLIADVHALL